MDESLLATVLATSDRFVQIDSSLKAGNNEGLREATDRGSCLHSGQMHLEALRETFEVHDGRRQP